MFRVSLYIPLLLIVTLLASCQQQSVMPDEVAREYWNAVKSGNTARLKNLTINDNKAFDDQLIKSLQLKDFQIKRTIIEKQNAIVEVDLELAETGSIPVPVNTVLIKHNKTWRVDNDTTIASLRSKSEIGDAIAALHQFSRMFSKGLDQSLDELERQAPVIRNDIKELMGKMSARLPVLKNEFEKLLKDIDETVKPLTEQDKKPLPRSTQPPAQLPQSMNKTL